MYERERERERERTGRVCDVVAVNGLKDLTSCTPTIVHSVNRYNIAQVCVCVCVCAGSPGSVLQAGGSGSV